MLNINKVKEWNWISDEWHNGKIPEMPIEERKAHQFLADEKCMRRLTKYEFALFRALDRKFRYRAKKSVDTYYPRDWKNNL